MAQIETEAENCKKSGSARRPESRLRRWGVRTLWTGVVLYFLAAGILYLMQNWIIFPGAYLHGRRAATVEPAPGYEIVHLWTAQGQPVAAVFGSALNADGSPRTDAERRPTVLYFYGNGDCLRTSMDQFLDFRHLGANVLIPEYVGYPMSGGRPSEAGCYATADAAYAYLLSRPDIDPKQIVIVGRSIGTGPAIDLAARKPVAGLVTFSAFTSMDDMARKVLPLFPTSLFLRSHFNNERKIADVTCPVLMAHGTSDTLVPFGMMARVASRARAHVTTLPVSGADHNDIFLVGGDALLARCGEFLNSIHQRD